MRVLITGVTGFAGGHLAEHLLSLGHEVWGIARGELSEHHGRVIFRRGDLLDASWLASVLGEARPDWVGHLAGQASVRASWDDPAGTWEANVVVQERLLHALLSLDPPPRVLIVGSWEEYGPVPLGGEPWTEASPLLPQSPYALTKAVQDLMGYQYFAGYGLPCIRVRSGNQLGPGQAAGFVAADFTRQVAQAEAGLQEPVLQVGQLDAQRDFTDVRDAAAAYELALRLGEPGAVYNIGSGRQVRIGKLLELYRALARVPLEVRVDPAALRPRDAPLVAADVTLFRQRTGWRPRIPLEQSLEDTLEYWRTRVGGEAVHPRVRRNRA
jgi:GDP-4-dehydro-6-deoxy-D-mannose reductase